MNGRKSPSLMAMPDVVLPSQYLAANRKPTPELRLLVAVMQEAIKCVEKYRFATNQRGQRIFREVTQWLYAGLSDWPYSFEQICDHLDLDANSVRRQLRVGPLPPAEFVCGRSNGRADA